MTDIIFFSKKVEDYISYKRMRNLTLIHKVEGLFIGQLLERAIIIDFGILKDVESPLKKEKKKKKEGQ